MTRAAAVRRGLVALAAVAIVATPLAAHADHRLANRGHWDRTSSVAHVKFLDFTGDAWPVGTAHADWDQAAQIDVDWVIATPSSSCLADCVRVGSRAPADDPNFGANCTGAAGYWTNFAPNPQNHWTQGNYVRFNRSCNDRPYATRRALTCQELGHALGLDHAATTDSCMFQTASQAASTPRAHDYFMLDQVIYDH